ncbi:MAG: Response regulatory domain-containing protein [Nitrospira sp.]|nr:response regulator [Nitrospira sp.]ULA58446.1 MAG: Response regulatory domain-containing protein [Nitrospira sp.]
MSASILLIDDSPGECELFRQALTHSGYTGRLDIVEGGQAAMAYLNAHGHTDEPALILLDLKLRGERGVAVLKQIKEEARVAHIPVVILTSSDDAMDVRACYDAGANGYVVKPGQFDDLVTLSLHIWKFWLEHNCTQRMAAPC